MSTSGKTSIETNVQICQKMVISLRELMDETKNLRRKFLYFPNNNLFPMLNKRTTLTVAN